jgi:GT2 family glycosyltransferase
VPASLSVIVVTYNSRAAIERALPALGAELLPGDEVIVADNHSADGSAERARELLPEATVFDTGRNAGFSAAVNEAAARARGELLLLLNPDAAVAPGFAHAIRRPLEDGRGWSAWQALVTLDDGRRVNTSGGVVHFTGVAWAGQTGVPVDAPREPCAVGFASGACLAVPARVWRELGGLPDGFFLYHEDVDLSLRIRLRGGHVGIEPAARADHDYEFAKGSLKWRMLERNRWATIVRTYPGPLLALLAPALLAAEAAVVAAALTGGWGRQKLLSWLDVARALPELLRERRAIQGARLVGSAEFASALTPELSSAQLGRAARSPAIQASLRAYWRLVRALLASAS